MLLFIAKKSFLQLFLITVLLWLFCELIWLMPGLGRWTRNREGTIPNFSSMSLFIGLFSFKIKDESHFKLLYFCFTNTVILASKNLNPMHKLCFSSKPIFQIYVYFHLRFLTDLTLEVDMPSLKMFVKNMHNLMHLRMV